MAQIVTFVTNFFGGSNHGTPQPPPPSPPKKAAPQPAPVDRAKVDVEKYRARYPGKVDNPQLTHNSAFYHGKEGVNKDPSEPIGAVLEWTKMPSGELCNLLERRANFLQDCFPIRETSRFNHRAQELQMSEAKEIIALEGQYPPGQGPLCRLYVMMLTLYGLKLLDPVSGKIGHADNFEERYRWLNSSTHYFVITRILKSLGELGYERFQPHLVRVFVEDIFGPDRYLPGMVGALEKYWIEVVRNDKERESLKKTALKLKKKLQEPFDFPASVVEEVVIKRTFDGKKWNDAKIKVRLNLAKHFAKGGMRLAFEAMDMPCEPGRRAFVAKRNIPHPKIPFTYDTLLRDVEMQVTCQRMAHEYNQHIPPKKVEFVETFIIERLEKGLTDDMKYYTMEPFIYGPYEKHNNNNGWVNAAPDSERNTPHAFSHFTWEKSGKKFIAIDIQGVNDLYTDPQIHTIDGKDFGQGNQGPLGIAKFFHSHRCNAICKQLGLTVMNLKIDDKCTQPAGNMKQLQGVNPHEPSVLAAALQAVEVEQKVNNLLRAMMMQQFAQMLLTAADGSDSETTPSGVACAAAG